MREKHIESFEDLYEKTDAAVARFNDLSSRIKTAEAQMAANLALQKHIQTSDQEARMNIAALILLMRGCISSFE